MSVNPSPIGGYAGQFFDNNGVILSGGKIYTYAAGTTTPQATYTNASGATPHSNPIVLDSAGRVPGGEIWLTDGLVYKFVIETSNGILIGSYDNITGVNSNFVNYTVQEEVITATAGQTVFNLTTINYTPGTNSLSVYIDGVNQYVGDSYLETDSNTVTFTSGVHVGGEVKFTTAIQTTTGAVDASIVSYEPPFTGGVATTVEDKLAQYVSVKDFGAVGNGVADDTAAIQAAANGGSSVFFPAGNYRITDTVIIPAGCSLNGCGYDAHIVNDAATRGLLIDGDNVVISNLSISGAGSTAGWVAGRGLIIAENVSNITVSNVRVYDARSSGIVFSHGNNFTLTNFFVENTLEHGVYISYCERLTISNGVIANAGQLDTLTFNQGSGFKIGGCKDVCATNLSITNPAAYGTVVDGYIAQTTERVYLSNLNSQSVSASYAGLRFTDYVSDVTVAGGEFKGTSGIFVQSNTGAGIPTNIRFAGVSAVASTDYGLRVQYGNEISVYGGTYSGIGGNDDVRVAATAGTVRVQCDNATVTAGANVYGYTTDATGNLLPVKTAQNIGADGSNVSTAYLGRLTLADFNAAPTVLANYAQLYVDSADGDLKVIFGNGVVKTIATN